MIEYVDITYYYTKIQQYFHGKLCYVTGQLDQ